MIQHGISDFGVLDTTVAATNLLQGGLSLASAVTSAGASAIVPPGSEGASLFASVKQQGNVGSFIGSLQQGLAEMTERNMVVNLASAELTAVDTTNAAMTTAVDSGVSAINTAL